MELTLCFMGHYKIKEKIMKMTVRGIGIIGTPPH